MGSLSCGVVMAPFKYKQQSAFSMLGEQRVIRDSTDPRLHKWLRGLLVHRSIRLVSAPLKLPHRVSSKFRIGFDMRNDEEV